MRLNLESSRKYLFLLSLGGAILIHYFIFSLFTFTVPFLNFPKPPTLHFLGSILKNQETSFDIKSVEANDRQEPLTKLNAQLPIFDQSKKSSNQPSPIEKPFHANQKLPQKS